MMLRPLIATFEFTAAFVPVATTTYSPSSSLKAGAVFHADVVWIGERSRAVEKFHVVAAQLVPAAPQLRFR